MVDFWEIVGRLVTDGALRTTLFNAISTGSYPLDTRGYRIVIPSDHYDGIRTIVGPKLHGPVSLMALGEILYLLADQRLRVGVTALSTVISNSGAATTGRSAAFYTALGAMVFDDTVRTGFEGDDFTYFPGVTGDEKNTIVSLAVAAGPLQNAASELCRDGWNPDCFVKFRFYTDHTHPLANTPYTGSAPALL